MYLLHQRMRKPKREVSYGGNTYKVRSDTVQIPDFEQMERIAVLQWLCHYTYARGYSKPNPLQGLGGAITMECN